MGTQKTGVGLIDSGISQFCAFAVITYQVEGGAYALYVNGVNMGEGPILRQFLLLAFIGRQFQGRDCRSGCLQPCSFPA